jgi:hypothetical protein
MLMNNVYMFAHYAVRRDVQQAELQLTAMRSALGKPGVVVELKQKLRWWMDLQLELKKAS